MKIGVFSYALPGEGRSFGGIERVAHDVAQGLGSRGHDVVVWSFDPAPAGAKYRVRPLPWRGAFDDWLGRRLMMGYLGNVLALLPDWTDRDVILSHGDSLLLPLRGKPVVRVFHGSALGEVASARSPWRALGQFGVYLQERLSSTLWKGSVAVSENTRTSLPGIRRVIPNGVDRSLFFPDESQRSPHPLVVFVGALEGRKRGSLLVKWFTEVVRPHLPEAELLCVAQGENPPPGVRYLKGLPPEKLALWLRRAWIYASPSRYEGFGLPYVEAMASGTPVLATSNPGSREVTEGGRWGVLAHDEKFPEELRALLTQPERRAALRDRGLQRAAAFDLTRTLDAYEAVLREAVEGATDRSSGK